MGLSILSDFKDEDLETMMDLGVKYSGEGSYAEPVSYSERYSNDFVTGRDLCDEAVARDYSVSNPHSTSWASALVLAAEAALSKEGHVVPLSLTYVLKCLPKYQEVGLNDVSPTDIMEFVIERGLMSKEAASFFDNDEDSVREYIEDLEIEVNFQGYLFECFCSDSGNPASGGYSC